jgi:replication-associated recombination protein RarA
MSNILDKQDFLWVEKYRPKTVSDCILPKRIKDTFQTFVDKKEIPVLLLSGSAGVGKTTIAKALCEEVGCDYLFINGSDESGIDTFRTKIKQYAGTLSLAGGRKVIIIDEADYLNPNSTQPALRSAIEEFSKNCTFVFTCNYKTRIIDPLQSRCTNIDFTLQSDEKKEMAMAFFARVKEILAAEFVEADMKVVAQVVQKFFPDYRRVLNELQRYSANGKIDEGILASVKNVEVKQLVDAFKGKDFGSVRKWAAMNCNDPTQVYPMLYKELYNAVSPECIPMMIIYVGDYQYKSAFVADQELNLVACLAQIMVDCTFK